MLLSFSLCSCNSAQKHFLKWFLCFWLGRWNLWPFSAGMYVKSGWRKSVLTAWLGSPGKSQIILFSEYSFSWERLAWHVEFLPKGPLKWWKRSVSRDMVKFGSVCCCYCCVKINPFVKLLGQVRKLKGELFYLILSWYVLCTTLMRSACNWTCRWGGGRHIVARKIGSRCLSWSLMFIICEIN